MEQLDANNYVRLCGTRIGEPEYSHASRGLDFYVFPLRTQRLSGNTDTINVLVRSGQLEELGQLPAEQLCVEGELRSFNSRRGSGARLVITVLAQNLSVGETGDGNLVVLKGTLCKEPNARVTPMGREICDLMLAVNRHYGRSDYLPCICWGQNAREAARWETGTRVRLEGRIQSRDYMKQTEDGPLRKTAFEVSATALSRLEP